MSNECGSCRAETDLFLCTKCCGELRRDLGAMVSCGVVTTMDWDRTYHTAGLLQYLAEETVGQSRKSETVRHTRHTHVGVHGDDHPITVFPNEDETDLDKAREQRHQTLQRRMLALGKVNAYAADLEAEIRRTLKVWAEDLATKHARPINAMNPFNPTASDYAAWLAGNTDLVARDEDGWALHKDLRRWVQAIERVVNRPPTPRLLGPCPSPVGVRRAQCATRLEAPEDAVRVTCPSCGNTHEVAHLLAALLAFLRDKRGTSAELRTLFDEAGYRLPEGTLKTWVHRKKLHPVGWMRADGHRGIRKRGPKDLPVYLAADLLRLMGVIEPETATA